MSVVPFQRKKDEFEETHESSGVPAAYSETDIPDVTHETAVLAKRHQRMRRAIFCLPIFAVALVVAYWLIALLSHKIDDDLTFPQNIRQTWSSPWAGVSASILEREYDANGWAPSASEWTPVARLTAKPAWQTALVEALGEHAGLAANQLMAEQGGADPDLATAARLLSGSVNLSELRAAREALLSYDGRVRRHTIAGNVSAQQFTQRLVLMASWASASNRELMDVFHTASGSPLDDHAVVSVYRARARAYAAHRLISAMDNHYRDEVQPYRDAALRAWGRAAEFSPLFVLNGSPDSMFFSSHPASMRSLLLEAEAATLAYAEALLPAIADEGAIPDLMDGAGPLTNDISYRN